MDQQATSGGAVYISSCQEVGIYNILEHFCAPISIVLVWVLISPSKVQSSNFLSPPVATKKLNQSPRQIKSTDNSNVLHMFKWPCVDMLFMHFKG